MNSPTIEKSYSIHDRIKHLIKLGFVGKFNQQDLTFLGMTISEFYKGLHNEYVPKERRKEGNNVFSVRVYPEEFLPVMDAFITKHFKSKPIEMKTENENTKPTEKKRKRIKRGAKLASSDKGKL